MNTIYTILAIIAILFVFYNISSEMISYYAKKESKEIYNYKHDNSKWLEDKDVDIINDILILAIQQQLIMRYIIFGLDKTVVIFIKKDKKSPLLKILDADKEKFKNLGKDYLIKLSTLRQTVDKNKLANLKKYPKLGPHIYNWADTVDTEETETFEDFTKYGEIAYEIDIKEFKLLVNLIKLYL